MRNHVFEQTEKYRDLAAAHAEDLRKYAQLGYNTAHDQLSSLLSKFVLSEVFVLKLMLISFGVLIGTAFLTFSKSTAVSSFLRLLHPSLCLSTRPSSWWILGRTMTQIFNRYIQTALSGCFFEKFS